MSDTEAPEAAPETWAVVEIFGHRSHAGRISEIEFCGAKMLRIDVPSGDQWETHQYAPTAIFSLRPCSEEYARKENEWRRPRPVALLEAPPEDDDEFDEPDFSEVDDGDSDDDLWEPSAPEGATPVVVSDTLCLLGERFSSLLDLTAFSPDDLSLIYDWAMRSHTRASDNYDVRVPPMPECLRPFLIREEPI